MCPSLLNSGAKLRRSEGPFQQAPTSQPTSSPVAPVVPGGGRGVEARPRRAAGGQPPEEEKADAGAPQHSPWAWQETTKQIHPGSTHGQTRARRRQAAGLTEGHDPHADPATGWPPQAGAASACWSEWPGKAEKDINTGMVPRGAARPLALSRGCSSYDE